MMSSRKWIVLTLLATLSFGGSFVALNVWLDIYGLFRSARGRSLPIYESERRGKYLLSRYYVPENFEAVLIGSSVTGNWNTEGLELFRTYNESTDGGNITEEKVLVERALLTPGIKAAICILHPFLTDTHGLNTEELSDREYWAALGSTTLLRTYKFMFQMNTGRAKLLWAPSGFEDVEAPAELNPILERVMAPGSDCNVDETAFAEYSALVATLRKRGVKLIAVVPPTREDLLEAKREGMSRYTTRMQTMFAPSELFIDFNAPEFEAFRRDRSNYTDGVHFSRSGATAVVRLLNQRMLTARSELTR